MALTSNGSKVVTGGYDKSLVVLDVNTLKLDRRIEGAHDSPVSYVAANQVTSDVIASSGNDGKVLTWDLKNGTEAGSSLNCKC